MKAFIIVREGYEYDDQYYHRPEDTGEVLPDGFRNRSMAQDECDRLNGKHLRERSDVTTEDGEAIVPYKVVEVEIENES